MNINSQNYGPVEVQDFSESSGVGVASPNNAHRSVAGEEANNYITLPGITSTLVKVSSRKIVPGDDCTSDNDVTSPIEVLRCMLCAPDRTVRGRAVDMPSAHGRGLTSYGGSKPSSSINRVESSPVLYYSSSQRPSLVAPQKMR